MKKYRRVNSAFHPLFFDLLNAGNNTKRLVVILNKKYEHSSARGLCSIGTGETQVSFDLVNDETKTISSSFCRINFFHGCLKVLTVMQ